MSTTIKVLLATAIVVAATLAPVLAEATKTIGG